MLDPTRDADWCWQQAALDLRADGLLKITPAISDLLCLPNGQPNPSTALRYFRANSTAYVNYWTADDQPVYFQLGISSIPARTKGRLTVIPPLDLTIINEHGEIVCRKDGTEIRWRLEAFFSGAGRSKNGLLNRQKTRQRLQDAVRREASQNGYSHFDFSMFSRTQGGQPATRRT